MLKDSIIEVRGEPDEIGFYESGASVVVFSFLFFSSFFFFLLVVSSR